MSAIIHEGLKQPVFEELALDPSDFSPHPPFVEAGKLIDDRYISANVIGSGGQARVIRALDKFSGEFVALKLPRISNVEDLERFQREVELTAAFTEMGEDTVKFVGAGVHHTRLSQSFAYMATELMSGSLLEAQHTSEARGMSVEAIVRATRAPLGAVATAHSIGILHKDLKPANILLEKDGTGKASDWGLASPIDNADLTGIEQYHISSEVLISSEVDDVNVRGALDLLTPEQVLEGKGYSTATEVFATGVTFFMLQTRGLRPWGSSRDIKEYGRKLRRLEHLDLATYGVDPADPLKALTDSCLERDPKNRPTMEQVIKELDSL